MRINLARLAVVMLTLAGCRAPSPDAGRTPPSVVDPTFTRDVAPILFEHCSPCHRPGQSAPFALLEYSDVRMRAPRLAEVTKIRLMPPWLPEPGHGAFANQRRLDDGQIDLIQRWVDQGAIEGDPSDLPPAPTWSEGWQLGEPELVVRLSQPYTLRAGDADIFRNFVIPVPVSRTRYVRAVELRPGNPKIVHHATVGFDRTSSSRRLDADDPEPGYEGMLSKTRQTPAGHFLGWTPGKVPTAPPPDMSWPLEPGTDLVLQLHMLPVREAETVQPAVGFFFTDNPPMRTPFVIKLGSKTIDIPPGRKDYTATDTYTLPADVDALSVYPHAHHLARDMKGFATLPDGTRKWLIWIKDWDFYWQDQYHYADPLFLPRGTVLTMQYRYDNSAGNERNPHHPPQHVMFGPRSSDEMGDLWLQVVTRDRRDLAVLARDYADRELRADIASAEMRVALAPADAVRRNDLGVRYLQAGRVDAAIVHLREALRLNPLYAEAHNNLGDAFQAGGRLSEAIDHFRRAIRLRAGDERVHFNLGNALQAMGRTDDAIREFRRTLSINPDFADAHNNLGIALASQQQLDEAIRHFEKAVMSNPNHAEARNNLAIAVGSIRRQAQPSRQRSPR